MFESHWGCSSSELKISNEVLLTDITMICSHKNVTRFTGDLGTSLQASYDSGLQARLGLKQAASPSFTPPRSLIFERWSNFGLFSLSILMSKDSPSPSSARRAPRPLLWLRQRRVSGFSRKVTEVVLSLSVFLTAVPCEFFSNEVYSGGRFLLCVSLMVPMVIDLFNLSKLT